MIIEGILTTRNSDGSTNVAAMGVTLDVANQDGADVWQSFFLRPFEGSRSFHNLLNHPQGVFHILDDAELLAKSALADPENVPMEPAAIVIGNVLSGCVRAFEFEIQSADWSRPRSSLNCRVMKCHEKKSWTGWNRAQNAVLELTILATRVRMIPESEIRTQLLALKTLIEKTAGPNEWAGWNFVVAYLESNWAGQSGSEQGPEA